MAQQFTDMFSAHNPSKAVIKFSYSPDDNAVYIRAATALNPNLDLRKFRIEKGSKIFDWENKSIYMKLTWTEVASIAKALHPHYLKTWEKTQFFHQTAERQTSLTIVPNEHAEFSLTLMMMSKSRSNADDIIKLALGLTRDQTYSLAKSCDAVLNKKLDFIDFDKTAYNADKNPTKTSSDDVFND